jgi:sulfite exporter TauE/SafE
VDAITLSALLMGLFGGAHCVGMCGGVVGILCGAAPREARYTVLYNLGRVGAYTLLGLVFGALGTLSTGLFPLAEIRVVLRAIAAICMLLVGLHLAGFATPANKLEAIGAPIWRLVSPLTRRLLPVRSPRHAVALGALWGLMPCGMIYAALALATSAGTPAHGAATMAAFGAGTLPVMLAMGAMAQKIAALLARVWVRRLAGAVVLAFGLYSSAGAAAQAGLGAPLGLSHECCPTAR